MSAYYVFIYVTPARAILYFNLLSTYTQLTSIPTANGIPIEGWTDDPSDEALLDLLPVLDSLRFTSDVRRVLGLRTTGVRGVVQMRDRVEYVAS